VGVARISSKEPIVDFPKVKKKRKSKRFLQEGEQMWQKFILTTRN